MQIKVTGYFYKFVLDIVFRVYCLLAWFYHHFYSSCPSLNHKSRELTITEATSLFITMKTGFKNNKYIRYFSKERRKNIIWVKLVINYIFGIEM